MAFRIWGDNPNEKQLNRWSGILLDVVEEVGADRKVPMFAARSEIGLVEALVPTEEPRHVQRLLEATAIRFSTRLRNQGKLVAGLDTAAGTAKAAAQRLRYAAQIARAAQA